MLHPTRNARRFGCPETPTRPRARVAILAAFVTLLSVPAASTAQQVTVDFSVGPTGSIGTTYTDPATGLQALGMWCDGTEAVCTSSGAVWNPANLWRRNDQNGIDLGLGVCDPSEGSLCRAGKRAKVPGEFNELSDNVAPEIIYLALPDGYEWVSVAVASLDDNSKDGAGAPERGSLWADLDTIPSNGNATLITNYSGVNDGTPFTITIPAALTSIPFLFFEAIDFTGGGSTNNDYLVYTATLLKTSPTTTSTTTTSTTTTTRPTTSTTSTTTSTTSTTTTSTTSSTTTSSTTSSTTTSTTTTSSTTTSSTTTSSTTTSTTTTSTTTTSSTTTSSTTTSSTTSTTTSSTTTAPPTTTSTTTSSTTTTTAPPNCVIGLSSMEGNINIRPGDWVAGGYNFTFPSGHPAVMETVSAEVDIPVTCSNGQPGGTIRIPLGAPASCPNGICNPEPVTYTVAANDTSRIPTGDQNSVLSWQGAVRAPDLCNGGPMNAAKGASFSATISENPSNAGAPRFQFKYRDPNAKGKGNVDCADPNWNPISQRNDAATCGASWSSTVACP